MKIIIISVAFYALSFLNAEANTKSFFGPRKLHFSANPQTVRGTKCKFKSYNLSELQRIEVEKIFEPSKDKKSFYFGYFKFENQSDAAIEIFKQFFSKN